MPVLRVDQPDAGDFGPFGHAQSFSGGPGRPRPLSLARTISIATHAAPNATYRTPRATSRRRPTTSLIGIDAPGTDRTAHDVRAGATEPERGRAEARRRGRTDGRRGPEPGRLRPDTGPGRTGRRTGSARTASRLPKWCGLAAVPTPEPLRTTTRAEAPHSASAVGRHAARTAPADSRASRRHRSSVLTWTPRARAIRSTGQPARDNSHAAHRFADPLFASVAKSYNPPVYRYSVLPYLGSRNDFRPCRVANPCTT